MRNLMAALVLTVLVFSARAEDVITRFTPLGENERFAYVYEDIQRSKWSAWGNLALFAVRNNDTEDIAHLFSWKDVFWGQTQFTDDLRQCFFIALDFTGGTDKPVFNIYQVDGNTGEIRTPVPEAGIEFRASRNGRFISFLKGDTGSDLMQIFLFDVENRQMIGEFEWKLDSPQEYWFIYRYGDIFRVFATFHTGRGNICVCRAGSCGGGTESHMGLYKRC